jgi:hypothetical protein
MRSRPLPLQISIRHRASVRANPGDRRAALTLHLVPRIATARDVCKCIGASLCLTLATGQPPRPVPWSFLWSGSVPAPQGSPSTSLGNQAETNGVQALLVRRFRALMFSDGCGAVGPPRTRKLPLNAGEYAYCVLHWSVRFFLHELDLLVSFSQLKLSKCLQLIGGEVHLPYHDSGLAHSSANRKYDVTLWIDIGQPYGYNTCKVE